MYIMILIYFKNEGLRFYDRTDSFAVLGVSLSLNKQADSIFVYLKIQWHITLF